MRRLTKHPFAAAVVTATLLATTPGICTADDESAAFELTLDVGTVDYTPYGGGVYEVGDFAIEGEIQDVGSAFGQYVSLPDGSESFQLMLSGENTDWLLEIHDIQGQLGPGFSVIFSSELFTLVGDTAAYTGVMGSGTASGYTYTSDGTRWGYPGNRQNWQLSGELSEPLPPPPPAPLPEFAIDDVSIVEGRRGTRNAEFTVALSSPSDDTVSVEYVTSDGTARVSERDYYGTSGVLTFEPGDTTATIRVRVRGDRKRESDETFYVYLGNPVGALLWDDEGLGVILNDD